MQYEKFARAALARKEYKEAVHYIKQLLSHCTDAVKFICLKIESLIAWNKLPEAIEFTTRIQKLHNENADFLYWTGRLLTYNGQTDKGK
jgi:predicted Zn-dependent protease